MAELRRAKCPQCASERLWKAGFYGNRQRHLCRSCGYRFSQPHVKVNVAAQTRKMPHSGPNLAQQMIIDGEPSLEESLHGFSLFRSEDIRAHCSKPRYITTLGKGLKGFDHYNRNYQVCAKEREAKNLVAIEIAKDGLEARQATRQLDEATFKGLLVNFAFWMKKLGYAESTIKTRTGDIRTLYYKRANLYDSESVKEVIANSKITNGTKHAYIVAYKTLARFAQIDLGEMPKYRIDKKAFYLPKKAELDMLIAGAGWKTGAFLQLLAETGARTIEAAKIKWPDVDSECKRITITNPAKNGKPRRLKVSTKLIEMLMRQPRQGQYVFGENAAQRMRKNFYWTRKHIVAKTANKNLQEIHLHSFRHFFATKLYLQTRDIRYVQKKLGHRNITSTTIYENSDPDDTDVEQYTIKAVTSKEDAVKLGELGYEPFDTIDEVKLYRKKVLDVA